VNGKHSSLEHTKSEQKYVGKAGIAKQQWLSIFHRTLAPSLYSKQRIRFKG